MKTNECAYYILFVLGVHIQDDGNVGHVVHICWEVKLWASFTFRRLSWNCPLVLSIITTFLLHTKDLVGILLPLVLHPVPSIGELPITQFVIEVMPMWFSSNIYTQ